MKMPTETFTWDNPPSVGYSMVMPNVTKAYHKAFYEHSLAGLPVKDFTFTYTYTEDDLKGYI